MNTTNEFFYFKILEEVGYAFMHGVNIKTPITYSMPAEGIANKDLTLPQGLINFYNQTSKLEIIWELQDTEENIQPFKENQFIKEKYLDNNYDWGVVKELLSGYINITKFDDLFDPTFCKNQAYYSTLSNKEENQDDFFPFDICWSLTACLKKDGNQILDNVWLVNSDAEEVYDMKITIEEYINLAYQAKVFHYWQLIYLFKEKTEYYELMKRFLPQILPHVELNLEAFGIEKK